ncbi:hypothetical protein [Streptomyces sp. 3211.6]|uniref:hypothetical protein n=1 Tax=Streptomyces sp. 3211.6 TaxID=1938845 RepID=UPI0016517E04|nr:hypothetical protein [Streptomyces sp. 3211.6]
MEAAHADAAFQEGQVAREGFAQGGDGEGAAVLGDQDLLRQEPMTSVSRVRTANLSGRA